MSPDVTLYSARRFLWLPYNQQPIKDLNELLEWLETARRPCGPLESVLCIPLVMLGLSRKHGAALHLTAGGRVVRWVRLMGEWSSRWLVDGASAQVVGGQMGEVG